MRAVGPVWPHPTRRPTRAPETQLEDRLSGRGFFKAHRAYLVNLQHVTAVIQYTRNSYSLQLDDDSKADIPLSKQSERALHDLLGY